MEGAVTVGGRDVAGTPLWELAQTVGSVFQNPKSQFFNLDTTGEVLFGLESRGARGEEMSRPWIPPFRSAAWGRLLDRNIFALSGGEKQRIACASAWAMGDRRLFVLDEPSSNLDGEGIRQLRDILKQLKSSGKKSSWWQSTVCGTPQTWLTGCFICGKGSWSVSIPGRSSWLCRKRNARPWVCGV